MQRVGRRCDKEDLRGRLENYREDFDNPGRRKRKQFTEVPYSWPLCVCKLSHL